jgi:DNA excision repair protein ERCC-3
VPTNPTNPLIVQSDRSLLLEVDHPLHDEARDALAQFAELEKSPEHIHTYRLSPLSLWNATAAGLSFEQVIAALTKFSKYDLPSNVITDIHDYMSRYGRLKLTKEQDLLLVSSADTALITEVAHHKLMAPYLIRQINPHTLSVDPARRGHVKQALIHIGFPAEDLAGYTEGAPLPLQLRLHTEGARAFALRGYQQASVDAFHQGGSSSGGCGVIVLPCGAGKTIVGIGAIVTLQRSTLILSPNTIAVRQWIHELLDKTTLDPSQIGEYTGDRKNIRPITVSTYQILAYRPNEESDFPHFSLFTSQDWGLIIYDEVHLLPAPIFRITAEIQARRRLGLTATLVREDGREADVFGLIGPKRYDIPWRELERQGWIATAECHEIRVSLPEKERLDYAIAEDREKYRIAAENPNKLAIMQHILAKHPDDQILILGQYIDQLKAIADLLDAPLLTGRTPNAQREKVYERFRAGHVKRLVVSKVANFAINLPDANVAIQLSGTFGSRQEEAQRLGRILRAKTDGSIASFYTIVTRDTRDQDFSANRQLFLTEQGYRYLIEDGEEMLASVPEKTPLLASQGSSPDGKKSSKGGVPPPEAT